MQHNDFLDFVLIVFYHSMCDQCVSLYIIIGAQSITLVNSTKPYDKQCYIMMDSAWYTLALDIFQKNILFI